MRYRKILLLDDDEEDQQIFLTALSSLTKSIDCVILDNPMAALEKLTSQEIDPDFNFPEFEYPVDGRKGIFEHAQKLRGNQENPHFRIDYGCPSGHGSRGKVDRRSGNLCKA